MLSALVAATAKRKAAEAGEERKSPLDSRAERKQRDRDKAADARRVVSEIGLLSFFLVLAAAGAASVASGSPVPMGIGLLVAFNLLFSLKVARQWERAVVLRFGKFQGLKGPGLLPIIPVVDVVSHLVDQRIRVSDVTAESAVTRDTVPVNVDAIVF